MKIAVRLDDITPDMDWERFYKFKALLEEYRVKPLIGVIPDNQDKSIQGNRKEGPENFWDYINQLQQEGWSIAMHGCRHIYSSEQGGLFPLNHFSEFAGIPYEEQLAALKEGKAILESKGVFTDIFMAPAHSYDNNTLRALKEAGFQKLTDGFGSFPYEWKGLTFYPISFKLDQTFRKKKGFSTMVIHTGTVTDEDLERYRSYFQKPSAEWISYKEYLSCRPMKRGILGRIKEYLMAVGKAKVSGIMR